jgi:hypothetical protein
VEHAPGALLTILTSLWDALLSLRDSSAAVPSVLELLSTMIDFQTRADPNRNGMASHGPPWRLADVSLPVEVLHCHNAGITLAELVARFWPFLRHTSSTIRQAVLKSVRSWSPEHCTTRSCSLHWRHETFSSTTPSILTLLSMLMLLSSSDSEDHGGHPTCWLAASIRCYFE